MDSIRNVHRVPGLPFLRAAQHIWNLPNTLIGLLLSAGGSATLNPYERVLIMSGTPLGSFLNKLGYAAMCIGDVIVVTGTTPQWLMDHEVAHAKQGRIVGILYLPLTFLGYATGWLLYPTDIRKAHDASFMEIWADVMSHNQHRNRILRARDNAKTKR